MSGNALGVALLKHALSTPGREQDLVNRIREHREERSFMTKEIVWQRNWNAKVEKRQHIEQLLAKVKARWLNKLLVKAFR